MSGELYRGNQLLKSFASDNYSGCLPEVIDYLSTAVNSDHAVSYGDDPVTHQATAALQNLFPSERLAIHFVMSGTAANVIALDCLIDKGGSVITADSSHLSRHEAGAPHRLLGCKLITVQHCAGKITPAAIRAAFAAESFWGRHATPVQAVSIAQPTEYGACYSKAEMQAIAEVCRDLKLKLHIDGCRLFNAAAALEQSLDELSFAVGADALSLGGTKNGLINAEAVLLKSAGDQSSLDYRVKQLLNLQSKHRFLSGQYLPFLTGDLWRQAAIRANSAATKLADQLIRQSYAELIWPVETNQVFAYMGQSLAQPLSESMHFYIYGPGRSADEVVIRLVTSFDTSDNDIAAFSQAAEQLTADLAKGAE